MKSVILLILSAIIFSGCTHTRTVYVDREVEVMVPVYKKPPPVVCDFDKDYDPDVVIEMARCIFDMREACYGK